MLLAGLAVIGIRAMLAQEVLILDVLRGRGCVRLDLPGIHRHLGDLLQHHGVIHRLRRILAPGEGALGRADDPRRMQGLDLPFGQLLPSVFRRSSAMAFVVLSTSPM